MALEDHDGEQVLQRFEQASRRIAVALVVSAAIQSYNYAEMVAAGSTRESMIDDITGFAKQVCDEVGI